ncbi:hypothetical protein JYA35_09050 [Bacillus velezensis]|uniref:hypothetical protein n=1 Tax=Bacillus velezensis TaxID=492670 RepID=UPI0019D3FBDF|nr:hypothetical protein [Bacillus velezensis]MBN7742737.1 hypothetical protein [Bacillus velezensis]
MKIHEVLLDNKLNPGEKCYLNQEKYTYRGVAGDGRHVLEKQTQDGVEVIYTDKRPAVPVLPLELYFKNKRTGSFAELVSYTHMLGEMYYKLKLYDNVFNGYDNETLGELEQDWELLSENPFKDEEILIDELEEVNEKIKQFEKEIREIKKKKIEPLVKQKSELQKQCKHEWYKNDEEQVGSNSYEQECVCEICGLEKKNRYSKLF